MKATLQQLPWSILHPRIGSSAVCGLLLLFSLITGTAQPQFTVVTNDGALSITGYTGPGGAVTIPDTLDGLPVTRIGENAFNNNAALTSVSLPGTVTNIGGWAFCYCIALTNAAIPDSVTSIGPMAFGYCYKLADLTLPAGLTSIGDEAFIECTSLTSVVIPASVTNLVGAVFKECMNLPAITVDPQNPAYLSLEGVLFDQARTTLVEFPCGRSGSYTIPSGVMSIGNSAFAFNSGLTNISVPEGVTNVADYAFYECRNLASLSLPESVTSIGKYAFLHCASLPSIVIPDRVTSIGASAFVNCNALGSIYIPASVTNIGYQAFSFCLGLANIFVDPQNPNYSSVAGVLFNKDQTVLIQCPPGTVGTYHIPNTVTNVGDYAFVDCWHMSGVDIPGSVTSLGLKAFYNCLYLTNILVEGNAPASIGNSAFAYDGYATVYYPAGATGWDTAGLDLPTVLWNPQILTDAADFGVHGNSFGFTIAGAPNLPVVIEAATDPGSAVWQRLQTCTLTNGAYCFSDAGWTNCPARFYRLRTP